MQAVAFAVQHCVALPRGVKGGAPGCIRSDRDELQGQQRNSRLANTRSLGPSSVVTWLLGRVRQLRLMAPRSHHCITTRLGLVLLHLCQVGLEEMPC